MRILKLLEKVTALGTQDWEAVPPPPPPLHGCSAEASGHVTVGRQGGEGTRPGWSEGGRRRDEAAANQREVPANRDA